MSTETLTDSTREASVFDGSLPVAAKLERARTELLDLSARNRLLNMPRSGKTSKIIEIIDEQSVEVLRLLVRDGRPFTFLAGRAAAKAVPAEGEGESSTAAIEDEDVIAELAQPDDDGTDERGTANRHIDTRLQTRLTPPGLQKRLLDLYHDARTLEEEQGVNILFLALGTLRWIDPNNAKNIRHAPLLLVPVSLERGNAAEKFKLRWRQEDVAANLSLEAYLDRVHSIKLPPFEGGDDFDLPKYAASVADAVSSKPGWTVELNDIVLGFFSFAKFLMYRDLDPENWPKGAALAEHPLIRPLLTDGFDAREPLLDEDAAMDAHIAPADMVHIVDSDSSQTLAVHEVRRGRDLVIQGPPGTGKSQTIANVIAGAVADGKTVLFVAEKMAALEVVKRRLDNTGVGDACLELHSNKANKRAVLEELRRTWELGAPRGSGAQSLDARLTEARDGLNAHATRMHMPLGVAGMTPYQVIGQLTRLKAAGQGPTDLELAEATRWTKDEADARSTLIAEVADRIREIGTPSEHVWRGIELEVALPDHVDRLVTRIGTVAQRLHAIRERHANFARVLEQHPPHTLNGLEKLSDLAARVATAPDLEPAALGSRAWRHDHERVSALLATGRQHENIARQLASDLTEAAWDIDFSSVRESLEGVPADLPIAALETQREIASLIDQAIDQSRRTATACGREDLPATLAGLEGLARLAERIAAVPPADAAALVAAVWSTGVERASDLADAATVLQEAKAAIGEGLSDAAWDADMSDARRVLASYGTSFFRFFSGDWRSASRRVRSILADPKTPSDQQIKLLDALIRGRKASSALEQDSDFGREAFGSDWRGEKTTPAPLVALVDWMRSLRDEADEARRIAAKRPDTSRLSRMAVTLSETSSALRSVLEKAWDDLALERSTQFGDAQSPSDADLSAVAVRATALSSALSAFNSVSVSAPNSAGEIREQLDTLILGQSFRSELLAGSGLAADAFGAAWTGYGSNWNRLIAIAAWIGANGDINELASRMPDRALFAHSLTAAIVERDALVTALKELCADIQAGESALVRASEIATTPTDELVIALERWRDAGESLSKWVAYRSRARRAAALGLGDLVNALAEGSLSPDAVGLHFDMAYYTSVFDAQVGAEPELAHFDGDLHNREVAGFADLDRQRIRQSALDVVRAHHKRIPAPGGGALGPLGVLKSEIARKRGHMPIRQLMQRAAPAIQALKPVCMMSPLSVAQFLHPGALHFDLLVMDEASQIQPVDALGAIARCKQVVVVGDPKQLPPTAFFAKMTAGDGQSDDEDGATKVADIESILGLFTARGLPTRMLRWHYRSRHESLIAVSNREFYENKLFIVPSPYTAQGGMGLRFHHIADGIFDTGATRTNVVEAKSVAKAIVTHAVQTPDLSLGVVAFSAQQKRAIMDQLEVMRRALPPEHEAFFQRHPAEPFFVKNLENVQGDERDVILISVGYGPVTPGGRPPMRFGPVGQEGGERRLNVLISRAKRRCEVFASMTDEDIDQDFASTRKGVFALKMFMHYARTGRIAMVEVSGRDEQSVFEEQVAETLQGLGYQVQRQVGIAGFFIDLAISDPERADRYVLGIECDGASYHSARSARDRDRLRQSILEDHGWIIHRIWSTDWFRRPKEQLDRVVAAIESAKVELASRGDGKRESAPLPFEIFELDRGDVVEIGIGNAEISSAAPKPYVEATIFKPSHLTCELHEAPTGAITALVEEVVGVEGPVHLDEVTARIRDAWGVRRAGARIQEAVERAAGIAVRQRRLTKEGDFLDVPGREVRPRDRTDARSATLRKPECLPPSEVTAALVEVARRNFGATEVQSVSAVSRAFGIKATSALTRNVISTAIASAIKKGVLVKRDELLEVGPNAPPDSNYDKPKPAPIATLVAEGEHERLEFKQSLRWNVNAGREDTKLEDVVIKTIAAFANKSGGALLIGVADDGTPVGIEDDLRCLGGNVDKLELHLTNLIVRHFSHTFRAGRVEVTFPELDGHCICRIDVQRGVRESFVRLADRSGTIADAFSCDLGIRARKSLLAKLPPGCTTTGPDDYERGG